MNDFELKLLIRRRLSALRVFKNISDNQVAVRCPFCGDSKNPSSAHFYIKIDINDPSIPLLFNCFRATCGMSGILNPSTLRMLSINDLKINSGVLTYNKKASKIMKKKLGIQDNSFNFKVPMPVDNEQNRLKKQYIETRLGREFTFEELVNLKTVFSLGQFLKYNGIENLTVKKEKAINLQKDFVGFLTVRNEFINFRDITNKHKIRFDKYSILRNLENTRKFYTIPNMIDLMSTRKITINLTEGVFDIFGVYYHIFEEEIYNMIYGAICGAGFATVIEYFVKSGLFSNVDLNIFSDKDVSVHQYRKMIGDNIIWFDNINIYYNELSKDYGVPKTEISLIRKKL